MNKGKELILFNFKVCVLKQLYQETFLTQLQTDKAINIITNEYRKKNFKGEIDL